MEKKENSADVGLLGSKKPKTFECFLVEINPFGLWQILILVLTIYIQIFLAMTNLEVVFYQITPDFACKLPTDVHTNWTLNQQLDYSSPQKDDDRDPCKIYDLNYTNLVDENYEIAVDELNHLLDLNSTNVITCDQWQYDRTAMSETVVTQWDLVCDKMWMVEHGILLNFLGFLFGSLISGFVSDKVGRKIALLGSLGIMGVFGIILSFVPSYTVFMIVRFVVVTAKISAALANFCYTLESTTGKARTWVGGLYFIPFACGYSLLAGVAYLTRDYRILNIICTAPVLLVLLLWWIIPESPRWLLANGRVEEARKVLETAARLNGRKMPDMDLNEIANNLAKNNNEEHSDKESFFHIFKYRVLVFRTIVIWFVWMVNTMVYYGLALNVSSFSGDVFLNNALAGAPVEFPAYALCTALLHIGRKPACYLSLFFCGLCLVIVPWIPPELSWIKVTLAMAGKIGITISFTVIYVHTTELFPTVIRNTGLAMSSAVSRIGPMLAPYISGLSKLGKSYQWLPLLIFGGFALAGGLATFLLPETVGRKMPEKLKDAVELGRKKPSNVQNGTIELAEVDPTAK